MTRVKKDVIISLVLTVAVMVLLYTCGLIK